MMTISGFRSYFACAVVVASCFASPSLSVALDTGYGGGRGMAMLTRPMTCYFDNATLFGSYSTDRNRYREFRFQLRGDGYLIVNGLEVKPRDVQLDGTSSWVAVDVGSIIFNPNEAAMLQLLPPDQRRQFQALAAGRGRMATGGVERIIDISFSDSSVVFRSIVDGQETDISSDRC
ncbi:hypothetical protein [Rhizobium sp. CAU 1783]